MALILKTDTVVVGNTLGNVRDNLSVNDIVNDFTSRVSLDGGVIVNATYLNQLATFLVENKLSGKVRNIASPSLAVKKDASNNVIRLYGLFGADFEPNYYTQSAGVITDKGGSYISVDRQLKYFDGQTSGIRPYILTNTSSTGSSANGSGGVLKEKNSNYICASNLSTFIVSALNDETSRPSTPLLGFLSSNPNDKNPVHTVLCAPGTVTDSVVSRLYDTRNDAAVQDGYFSSLNSDKTINSNMALSAIQSKKVISYFYTGSNNNSFIFCNQNAALEYVNYTSVTRAITNPISVKSKTKVNLSVPYIYAGNGYTFPNIKVHDIIVMRDLTLDQHKKVLEFLNSVVSV